MIHRQLPILANAIVLKEVLKVKIIFGIVELKVKETTVEIQMVAISVSVLGTQSLVQDKTQTVVEDQ